MDNQFATALSAEFSRSGGPDFARLKPLLTAPLSDPTLMSALKNSTNIYKPIIGQILQVFRSGGQTDACVVVIETLGALTREAPNVRGLVYTMQFFSGLARKWGNSSLQPVLDALRLEYAHLRRDAKDDVNRQIGMMVCLVEIIKICQNPNLVQSLLASAEGIVDDSKNTFPRSVSVTFHYYVAKHCLFMDRFDEARLELERAYTSAMSSSSTMNKSLILLELVPLKICSGIFPTKSLFTKFPSLWVKFGPILKSIQKRDIRSLRLQRSLRLFGLIPQMELLIHRLLVEDIAHVTNSRKVSLAVLQDVLGWSVGEPVTEGVAGEVAANLILRQRVTGYISYEERVLVLTGAQPFKSPIRVY